MADPVWRLHRKTNLVLYHEATAGTPGANGHQVPFVSRTFGITEEKGQAKRRPNSYNPVRTMRGFFKAEGNVEIIAEVTFLGMMLNKLFGAAGVTGGPVYLHKFNLNGDPGSFSVQEADASSGTGHIANLVKPVGFDISIDKQANEASFTIDLLGCGKGSKNSAIIDATPSTYVGDIFPLSNVGAKLDGSTSKLVTSVKLTGKRYANVPNTLNGLRYGDYVITGGWDITASVTGLWASDTGLDLEALANDEAKHSLELDFAIPSPGTDTLAIKVPETHFYVTSVPALGSEDGVREVTLESNVFYENSTEASAMEWDLSCATADFGALWAA